MASKSSSAGGSYAPLAEELVNEMQAIFGKHSGYRTTHAKGLLVEGTFRPTDQAKTLSIAPHFNNPLTPVTARFSVGGGSPSDPDYHNNATPKGIAIRFHIDDEIHSDLIAHSFNGFATRTGEEFLTFLRVARAASIAEYRLKEAQRVGGDTSKESENLKNAQAARLEFFRAHPSAAQFVTAPRPNPFNYGTITYYQPNTHVLINEHGQETNVRYRLDPADGHHLYPNDQKVLDQLGSHYLEEDLLLRFPNKPIILTIVAHIANCDDVLDDATVPYKSTTFVPIGELEINAVVDDNAAEQKQIAFDTAPERGGIQGIKSSDDPLIQIRREVYWLSAEQRRNEKQVE